MVEVLIVFMALLQSHLSLFHLLQNTFCFQGVAKMLQKQFNHWVMSANPHKHWVFRHLITRSDHSHSIVPVGFGVRS